MRKAAWLAAGAAVAGLVAWRRTTRGHEHVDLYFADGSMISLEQGSEEGERLMPLANEVLSAARS